MPRTKKYNEEEVIEKAMKLFWRNGFESTSTRMLEKEMGINQFSIYSSFGSKEGVLVESIKIYKIKVKRLLDKLANSNNGIQGIKQYFYDVLEFTKENNFRKGCLLANTVSELGAEIDGDVKREIRIFTKNLRKLFINNLSQGADKTEETINRQANYLIISISGLTNASKVYGKETLHDFIETTFEYL